MSMSDCMPGQGLLTGRSSTRARQLGKGGLLAPPPDVTLLRLSRETRKDKQKEVEMERINILSPCLA